MSPMAVDLHSGEPTRAGAILSPAMVLSTVLAANQLDASELRTAPIPGLLG